ncbi:tail protein [Rhodococcus phage PhailMary]|uniref:Holin n=1 Tax=Rhodococcus phage PhailMary TaxID=2793705 RepID=A0A7T0M3W5_9CAUD|nr:tail protein [Rhodococcus phage PhailMary]ASJ78828.1 holin [Rhodococcus phage Jester]QPL15182.1 holin [Rhodococcus phage PhailMary]
MKPNDLTSFDTNVLGEAFDKLIGNQPWYKRYANTVTTLVFTALQALWLAVSLGVDLPTQAVWGVAGLVLVGQVIGVKKTNNGVTDGLKDKVFNDLTGYVAREGGKHRA